VPTHIFENEHDNDNNDYTMRAASTKTEEASYHPPYTHHHNPS
jgi:hypothetical protein